MTIVAFDGLGAALVSAGACGEGDGSPAPALWAPAGSPPVSASATWVAGAGAAASGFGASAGAVGAAGTSSAVWPCDCDDCAAVTASGGSSGAPSLAAGGGGFSAWGRAATFFVSVLATATDTVCCEDSARVPSGEVVFKESA